MSCSVFLDRSLPQAAVDDEVRVAGPVAHHIRVTRIGADEEFDLVDGAGQRLRCVLAADASADGPEDGRRRGRRRGADDAPLTARVREVTRDEPGRPELVLVQALAKSGRDEQAIESATEMGVDRVVPWAAARSIAAWPAAKEERQHAKWRSLLDTAAQQSRRALAPELEPLARGGAVRERLHDGDRVLVLHEEADLHLADALDELAGGSAALPERIVLIVGPEGGIAPQEIEALTDAGAAPVLLGRTVLRASSAGPAGIALVQAALGRWRAPRP
ncbi:MAG TPA: 16S rRNA (uracil(1498)-N(3))-methyltransferase [Brevibacterium senegalense]|uniref:Ribosomal RNA small subunit methyltransferase E n=1 Tax=Brevibacterium senegalense TaxID=1033736 RepID=A0A921MCK6_9MICO|nr:16S rRNA (uracil(1498)-N(3))-methyltransferase [Brevibacterium senegalense]